jgi:hypothetical protein
MSFWLTIPLGFGVIAVIIALIRRGRGTVTTLHIFR